MDKLLTFSVAAYNVENTISRTLDSLVMSNLSLMDKMEVLIVDDGSTDHTFEVVRKYVDRYPETFKYHKKENGGHGSTLSYSIKHATGKYLRMLDGDDWANTAALETYIEKLMDCDSDIVVTPYTMIFEDGEKICNRHTIMPKKMYEIDNAFREGLQSLHAHEVAVKTEILKKNDVEIMKHCMFVDSEFCFYIELFAKSVMKFEDNIYQYWLGRAGQSVSPAGRMKHIFDARRIVLKELDYLNSFFGLSDDTKMRCYNQIDRVSNMQLENYNGYASMVGLNLRKEIVTFLKEIENINSNYYKHMQKTNWIAKYENILLESDAEKIIVIFGAGKRGELAVELFDKLECQSRLMITDNNENKIGKEIYGHTILPVKDVENIIESDYIIFIAMKNNTSQVKKQLVELGVEETRVVC